MRYIKVCDAAGTLDLCVGAQSYQVLSGPHSRVAMCNSQELVGQHVQSLIFGRCVVVSRLFYPFDTDLVIAETPDVFPVITICSDEGQSVATLDRICRLVIDVGFLLLKDPRPPNQSRQVSFFNVVLNYIYDRFDYDDFGLHGNGRCAVPQPDTAIRVEQR